MRKWLKVSASTSFPVISEGTDGFFELIVGNSLYELIIAPHEDRQSRVRDLLRDIAPSTFRLRIEPLSDSCGPAITEPRLGLPLVESAETAKVGDKINATRQER
jgi:phosphopantetheine adenylyltransferase